MKPRCPKCKTPLNPGALLVSMRKTVGRKGGRPKGSKNKGNRDA